MENKLIKLFNQYSSIDFEELNKHFDFSDKEVLKKINHSLNELERNFIIYFDNNTYYSVFLNDLHKGIFNKKGSQIYVDNLMVDSTNVKCEIGDEVLYQKIKNKVVILKVLKRNLTNVIGRVFYLKGKALFKVLYPNIYKVYELNKNYTKYNSKKLYSAKIVNYERNIVEIKEEVQGNNLLEAQLNSLLILKKVRTHFSKQVKQEVSAFIDDIHQNNYPDYLDYSDKFFMTIDGVSAKDYDDAICLEFLKDDILKLYVAIADVSAYVKENSALDKEASLRATSFYYANKVVPMLPFELSNNLCSLLPHKNRLTLVCEIYFKENKIIDYSINKAIINSKYRLTYDEVNDFFEKKQRFNDEFLNITLESMLKLSKSIRNVREEAGAINFKDDDLEFEISDGEVKKINYRIRKEAELLIEDFMLVGNEVIANHLYNLSLPAIYRNHSYPKIDSLNDYMESVSMLGYKFKNNAYNQNALSLKKSLAYFKDTIYYPIVSDLLLRSMSKALYSSNSEGHFALTFKNYCHFTSPIRRYPDLLVHRTIHKYLFNNNYDEIDNDIKKIDKLVNLSNQGEKLSVDVERSSNLILIANYMKKYLNHSFIGVIDSVTSYGLFIRLDNGARGLLHISYLEHNLSYDEKNMILYNNNVSYCIGKSIKVIVKEVDEYSGRIDFKIKNKISRWYN